MAVVEKVTPIGEAIAHRLPCIVTVLEGHVGRSDGPVAKSFAKPARAVQVSFVIVACRSQIFLVAFAGQNKLCVESKIGPRRVPSNGLENGERGGAPGARRPRSRGGTRPRVEGVPAAAASDGIISSDAGKNIAALRTDDLNFRLSVRTGVTGDDIRRKRSTACSQLGTACLHDPKIIEDVAGPSA